jgi:hypothetical protein
MKLSDFYGGIHRNMKTEISEAELKKLLDPIPVRIAFQSGQLSFRKTVIGYEVKYERNDKIVCDR